MAARANRRGRDGQDGVNRGGHHVQDDLRDMPWQIKRVNSSTGPVGTDLSEAIRDPDSIPGQTEMLWKSSNTTGMVVCFVL